VREHVREQRLTAGHARALMKTQDPSALAAIVISKGLSVRDTEALAKGDKAASKSGGGSSGQRLETKSADADKDVDTKALELDLQRSLGLEVDIRHINGKGGEVRIRYGQLEQLDEICRLLSRPRIVTASESENA
jgi:ParB family chromosome partitioning protein